MNPEEPVETREQIDRGELAKFLAGHIRERWGDVLDCSSGTENNFGRVFEKGFATCFYSDARERAVALDILFRSPVWQEPSPQNEMVEQIALLIRAYLIEHPLHNMEPEIKQSFPRKRGENGLGYSTRTLSFDIVYRVLEKRPGIWLISDMPYRI